MKVIELKNEMDAAFVQVRERFAEVDARFAQVDKRFAQVDERFAQVDARFDRLEVRLASEVAGLREEIREEGATTRRHFDVVAESLRSDIQLIAAGLATNNAILAASRADNISEHTTFVGALDDHELRLRVLERSRR